MPEFLVSPATAAVVAVGVVISGFYLRFMGAALQRASATLDDPDDGKPDAFAHSFVGAIFAVVASSLAIALYGSAPPFLYLGVALALASPIAVAYAFYRELKS